MEGGDEDGQIRHLPILEVAIARAEDLASEELDRLATVVARKRPSEVMFVATCLDPKTSLYDQMELFWTPVFADYIKTSEREDADETEFKSVIEVRSILPNMRRATMEAIRCVGATYPEVFRPFSLRDLQRTVLKFSFLQDLDLSDDDWHRKVRDTMTEYDERGKRA